MEIPVLDMVRGLEAELKNPAGFIHKAFHMTKAQEMARHYTFWTLGALIIAFFATFTSLIHRLKVLISRLHRGRSVTLLQPLIRTFSNDDDDEEEEEDDSCSVSSSCPSDYDEDEEDNNLVADDDDGSRVVGRYHEYRGQNGALNEFRRRFSWSDFTKGKNVVKSWEGFGSGAAGNVSSNSLVSLWDLHKAESGTSGPIWVLPNSPSIGVVSMPSPTVIMTAGLENCRNAVLRVWDTRVGHPIPDIFAEWEPCLDIDGQEITEVRDIRKIGSSIDNVTKSDVETWWDSDAVILGNDRDDEYAFDGSMTANGCDSVVSRCRNAMFSYLY